MNEKGVNMLRYESYSMLKIRFIEPRRQKVWLDIYTGRVLTNFLISFFAEKRLSHCLIEAGHLFQSFTPSVMKVFFELTDFPVSRSLFSIMFLDLRGLSGATSFIFMMFKGHSLIYKRLLFFRVHDE